jgi:hypothetical protein
MDHHQIGQHSITLVPPRSMAIRWEVFSLGAHSSLRASAAALALCWTGPGKPKATLERHQWSVGRWAGAVLDELLARGVALDQIASVGALAFTVLSNGLMSEDEVVEAGNGSGEAAL